jgi:hypothetical protein
MAFLLCDLSLSYRLTLVNEVTTLKASQGMNHRLVEMTMSSGTALMTSHNTEGNAVRR